MAVFPFTVRATDSEGSYSDRQFSITVRNSRVERFMFIDANNAYTSPDGTSWTTRTGQGGTTCAYGNGFWLVMTFPTASTSIMWPTVARKSTDGINWAFTSGSNQPTSGIQFQKPDGTLINSSNFPAALYYNSPATAAVPRLKFWNGKFWFMAAGNLATTSGAQSSLNLWSSVDGLTWTLALTVANSASSNLTVNTGGINGLWLSESDGALFIPNPSSANGLATNAMGYMTTDGVNFTALKDVSKSTAQYAAAITRINGLYLAQSSSTNGNIAYSTDGLNWTALSYPALSAQGGNPSPFFYMNGTIYSFTEQQSAAQTWAMMTSTDGQNFTATSMSAWVSSGSGIAAYPSIISKNGLLLISSNQMSPTKVLVSTDGSTFNAVNYAFGAINDSAAM